MSVIHGTASYPGVIGIESLTVTFSHGITPSVTMLKIQPQSNPVAPIGDLYLTDGNEEITIPDCRVDEAKIDQDESGFVVGLQIVDRRWKWRDLGIINGMYNQISPFGKLIPWTIRSPRELFELCLEEMLEKDYEINAPAGLEYPGENVTTEIINTSGLNPPINWVAIPPAQALQQLADLFGVRIIYQVARNRVLIAPLSMGEPLPDGSIHQQGPSLKLPEVPQSIGIQGAFTRWQVRLATEAVGEEWDGSFRPINLLSYAPQAVVKPQIVTVTVTLAAHPTVGDTYILYINPDPIQDPLDGEKIQYAWQMGNTVTDVLNGLKADFDKRLPLLPGITSAIVAGKLVVTGRTDPGLPRQGVPFAYLVNAPGFFANTIIKSELTQASAAAGADWSKEWPDGGFWGVNGTDRLTFQQAQGLARKSVYRYYRLTGVDVSGDGPIKVPGYTGRIVRRQQIIISDSQVDQIVPQPNDDKLRGADGQPINVNFYNGYSKDKPAVCTGEYAQQAILGQGLWFNGAKRNVLIKDAKGIKPQIMVPFSVDVDFQIVKFSDAVFYDLVGSIRPAEVVLQCACQVRHAESGAIESFSKVVPVIGAVAKTDPKYRYCADVQMNVTSVYDIFPDGKERIHSATLLELDPATRADYYLAGMAREFDQSVGQTLDYNGLVKIELDGRTQQVTWSINGSATNTLASTGTEHSTCVPPYPARRRAEFLAPNKMAAAQNALGRLQSIFVGPLPQ